MYVFLLFSKFSEGALLNFFFFSSMFFYLVGLPCGSDSKESVCNTGDLSWIPESGRSSGEGNSNPLPYSCLEKFMDRGAWQTIVHVVTKSQT